MRTRPIRVLGAIGLSLAGLSTLWGATIDWTGGGGNANWDNAANWNVTSGSDADGIPDGDDDVTFPAAGTYTSGVSLNGADRAANSLTFATITGFTLAGVGNTLDLTSGSVTRQNVTGNEVKQIITCNLNLLPVAGTNTWSISGYRAADNSTLELRGALTRSVPITLTSTTVNGEGALGIWAAGGLGSGDLTLGANASLLFGGVEQTVINPIALVGAGDRHLSAYMPVTLAGGIDIPAGTRLRFGYHNNVQHLLILDAPTTGAGNIELFRGALAINNLNQLTSGNLVMGAANGALILDGVAWSDLMANRSGGWGTGANQFQIGGGARFGARTAPLLIQDSGLDAAGVNTNNYFDRSFGIGAPHQKGGAFYANQPVTLDTDTRFTDCRTIEMAGAGPGFNGTHGTGLVHTITADLSDGGPALRGGVKITASPSTYSEVILAGANTWTGSHGTDANSIGSVVSRHFCGLGGLMTSGNTQPVFTTFASPASLPTGNAGNTAYLSAFNRSGGISGYLVTAAPGGAVYDTGTNLNWAFGSNIQAVLGSTGLTGDSASLEGSNVLIHSDLVGGSQNLSLLVRGGVLELGAAGNPLRFVPVTGNDTNATPITRSQPATTYTDATGTRTLIKRGSGTLILENIAYTTMDGSGDTSGQFLWQIGSGSNAVYDGAVRVPPIGTGDNSNSLENYNISLLGGVLESSGTFSRSLGTAANQVQWPNNTAGGGFSAYGGDLTVDLNNPGPDTFVWATTALFPRVNAPLIFGSATADATVRWSDNINLNNAARTVWVMRGTGTAPEADIQGLLSNGSLVKTGAGVLALSAPNTYAGGTTISDGTLRVANITGSAVGTGDVLINGGTLAGDGIVGLASNAANISFGANGGAISPGPTTAILTVYGNVNFTSAGATSLQIELNDATAGSGYDQLNIFGAVTLADATLNLTWMPGFTPTPGTTFTLIDNDLDDAVAGSFLDLPDGTEYLGGSINWRIDYDGGSGNDVVLTILAPIPEPASAALLALAGAAR